LPAGRRGRIALTLKDGGVMLEGEIEVASSSPKPSALYGRIGMQLKMVDLDEPSKTVLAELEKARLAMKPAAPSVAPRAANVPAEPRPVVPSPGGRVDSTNALAECVAIGDASVLAVVQDQGSGKAKFVVPSIPAVGTPRPKTPSTPPELARPRTPSTPPEPRSKTPSIPPKIPSAPPDLARSKTPSIPPALGMKPLAKPDEPKAEPKPQPAKPEPKPEPAKPQTAVLGAPSGATELMAVPPEPAPAAPPAPATPAPAAPAPEPPKKPQRMTRIGMPVVDKLPFVDTTLKAEEPAPKLTTLGMPAMKAPADSGPVAKPALPGPAGSRSPRMATPVAPLPVVKKPAAMSLETDAETTDLTSPPQPLASLPVEVMSAVPKTAETEDSGKAYVGPPPSPPVVADPPPAPPLSRSGGMRASEIMAAIPTDDWTMTPDASAPTVLPTASPPPVPVDKIKDVPKGPPTGDFIIAANPEAPDGWDAPSKLERPKPIERAKSQPAKNQPATGNPVLAVASTDAVPIQEWEDNPTGIGEPLVEIDSTLMEPLKPMPKLDDDEAAAIESKPPTIDPPPNSAIEPRPVATTGPAPLAAASGPAPLAAPFANAAGPAPLAAGPAPLAAGPAPLVAGPAPLGTGPAPLAPEPLPAPPTAPRMPTPMGMPPIGMPPDGAPPPPLSALKLTPPTGTSVPQQPLFGFGNRRGVTDAGTGFFKDSAQIPQYSTDAHVALDKARRKRVLIIVMAAAVAVAAGFVVVMLVRGGSSEAKPTQTPVGSGSGSAVVSPPVGSGSAGSAMVVEPTGSGSAGSGSAQEAVVTPDAGVAPTSTCGVEVASTPPGADVIVDKTVLGQTPNTFQLPCGTEVKLLVKKSKFIGVTKSVTPGPDTAPIKVTLAAAVFSVKVTSTPAGATITVGGKQMGVTPTTIKIPAFASSTITLTKDGFQPDTQKLAPRQNNLPYHVTLKKKGSQKLR
jgi:hypothetical protein